MKCNGQLKLLLKALEDPKQGPPEGSHGLVEKALEPKPSKDTSPDEPRLGSCKAYYKSYCVYVHL